MTQKQLKVAVLRIMERCNLDENGCLIWPGATTNGGYGKIKAFGNFYLTHRLMHLAFNGDPEGLCVCHECDVRNCVNPRHLWAGTYTDNNRDMSDKGRSAAGEKNGQSKLTAEDVLEIRRRHTPRGGAALAREFNVSTSLISGIVKRTKWKHLPPEGE